VGLVRFGSRVDVWMSAEAEILVKVGQNVKGGSSVIARIAEPVGASRITENISGRTNQKIKEDDGPA
jgi:phosphatidylserine decarboxylase